MSDPASRFMVAVVDDDRRVLASLAALLESADYVVRPYDSAAAMLESGSLAEIDCLISDVGMPVMDGFELAQAAQAARPGLPVILITGRSDLLSRAPLNWSRRYLLFKKPFDAQELLTALSDALRSPKSQETDA